MQLKRTDETSPRPEKGQMKRPHVRKNLEVFMIRIVSKGIFYEDKTDEALKLYEELVAESQKEKGCVSYNLYRDIENETILTMMEEWESEKALEEHKKSKHFTKIVPAISKLRKHGELNIYKKIL